MTFDLLRSQARLFADAGRRVALVLGSKFGRRRPAIMAPLSLHDWSVDLDVGEPTKPGPAPIVIALASRKFTVSS